MVLWKVSDAVALGAVLLVGSGRVARTGWSSDRMRIGCEWVVCIPGGAISVAYTPGVGGQCAHRTDEHRAGSRVPVRAEPPGSAPVGRARGLGLWAGSCPFFVFGLVCRVLCVLWG